VVSVLEDGERLRRARLHPLAVLMAQRTYAAGRGMRGQGTWEPVAQVVDALDGAFYHTFRAVAPTGKRWLLALDVSGSMGVRLGACPALSCREATAAMALVTAATERDYLTMAFAAGGGGLLSRWSAAVGWHARGSRTDPQAVDGIVPLSISPRQRLAEVISTISNLPFGGTDCSLPMRYALKHRIPVDVFVVYTDSETWAGPIHPSQALVAYREGLGIAARMIVVGMTATEVTIADPRDAGMLDVAGFDASAPAIMADFVAPGQARRAAEDDAEA
jgi:60 kDa SS-A/Ro ribonucleoprotein